MYFLCKVVYHVIRSVTYPRSEACLQNFVHTYSSASLILLDCRECIPWYKLAPYLLLQSLYACLSTNSSADTAVHCNNEAAKCDHKLNLSHDRCISDITYRRPQSKRRQSLCTLNLNLDVVNLSKCTQCSPQSTECAVYTAPLYFQVLIKVHL